MGASTSKHVDAELGYVHKLLKWAAETGISSPDATILVNHYLTLAHEEIMEDKRSERDRLALTRLREERKGRRLELECEYKLLKLEMAKQASCFRRTANVNKKGDEKTEGSSSSFSSQCSASLLNRKENYFEEEQQAELEEGFPKTPRPSVTLSAPRTGAQPGPAAVVEKVTVIPERQSESSIHRESAIVEAWVDAKEKALNGNGDGQVVQIVTTETVVVHPPPETEERGQSNDQSDNNPAETAVLPPPPVLHVADFGQDLSEMINK